MFFLYQQDLLRLTPQTALERDRGAELDDYASTLVMGVTNVQDEIDEILQRHLSGWTLGRLGVLERSILRVAAYELLWAPDMPSAVAIDEAVALAKRFCSDEAGALVNGVLGSLATAAEVGDESAARPQREAGG